MIAQNLRDLFWFGAWLYGMIAIGHGVYFAWTIEFPSCADLGLFGWLLCQAATVATYALGCALWPLHWL
jgi:hypothetical protein